MTKWDYLTIIFGCYSKPTKKENSGGDLITNAAFKCLPQKSVLALSKAVWKFVTFQSPGK